VVTFAGVRHNEFLDYWDDGMIFANQHLRALTWQNVRWALTDFSAHPRHVYMPCSWLWWMLVNQTAGLSPAVYHSINLVMHGINSVVVFFLVSKLSRRISPAATDRDRAWQTAISGVAALSWALHPLRVEPVAWAVTQIFLIATLLALLSFFSYLRRIEKSNDRWLASGWHWLSLACYAASLLFYPIALAWPAVLLVVEFCWVRSPVSLLRRCQRVAGAVIPFGAISLACASVPIVLSPPPPLTNAAALPPGSAAWLSQTMTAAYLWVYYVWRPWVPVNLSAIYTTLIHVEPWSAPFVASLLGLLALTGLAWALRRRHPWVLALWLCHLALLAPMLGFGSSFESYSSDRYAYLQGICWALLLAVVLQRLLLPTSPGVRAAWLLPCGGALVALSIASRQQAPAWRDSTAFYETLLRQPGIERYRPDLHWRLAQHYLDHQNLPAARSALENGLLLNPRYPLLLCMLADLYGATGDYILAEQMVRRAIALDPSPTAWRLLANICLHANRLTEAEEALKTALANDPRNTDGHFLWAVLLFKRGAATDALAELERVLATEPSNADAQMLRAQILQQTGATEPRWSVHK
jgi:cytochrome c-type biogenesis protein CcmH/NrfG